MVVLNSNGVASFVSAAVFLPIAVIAVVLRLLSKTFTKAKYGADDWWCLTSLALFCGWIAGVVWGSSQSYTQRVAVLTRLQVFSREEEGRILDLLSLTMPRLLHI